MYVDAEARLLFLAHPRTGSNAVVAALETRYEFAPNGSHHSRLRSGSDIGPGWLVLVGVRNHFAAMCSWLRLMRAHWTEPKVDAAFVDHVLNGGARTYTTVVPGRLWGLHLDGIEDRLNGARLWLLHQERLQCDLDRALSEHGTPTVRLECDNGRPPYQELVTDAGRRAVEREWGAEMAELGYRWDA